MRLATACMGVLVSCGWALGQQALTTESPSTIPHEGSIMQWLITAVFLVATLVVAFKPAKRSKLE